MSQQGLPNGSGYDQLHPVQRTNTDELIENYLNLSQPGIPGIDFPDLSSLPPVSNAMEEDDDEPPVAPTSYYPPQRGLPEVTSLFPSQTPLTSLLQSDPNESPFLDLDDTIGNSTALDGQFLVPGNAMGHYRSNSNHSDTSSIAHSPLFGSTSPLLPPTASSPALYADSAATGLEQITSNFSLGDSNWPSISNQQLYNNNPPVHTTGYSNETIYQASPATDNDFVATTPEIMVESVDVQNAYSPYASSTGSLSPSHSDIEPFPSFGNGQGLLPPSTGRRRSHSDSDLTGANGTMLYAHGNGSNLSIGSATSENNYLSPQAATTRHERNQRQALRNRSSSASQARSRSRSQSASREYILELASAPSGVRRVQRHPSTFACDMCDKRFTRAYNLRSHQRTHTDERPYACTVCDKRFARQHDRKRHEALHSGEKKYMCKGVLADGVTAWGCGHKFARADALGRHFRTEAGKECIRPLVEESERERRSLNNGVSIYGGNNDAPALTLSPPPTSEAGPDPFHGASGNGSSNMSSYFPPALLEQFPALSGLFQNEK